MSDQLSITSSPPLASQRTVKVWTPRTIGVLTFFLGFPGGITLTAINWIRMRRIPKAIGIVLAGLLATVLFVAATLALPEGVSRLAAIVLNFGFLGYLVSETRRDLEALAASQQPARTAHWAIAVLISMAALAVWLILILVLALIFGLFLALFGVPIPE